MLMNSIDKNISKINMEIIDYNALNTKLENGKLYSIIAFNFLNPESIKGIISSLNLKIKNTNHNISTCLIDSRHVPYISLYNYDSLALIKNEFDPSNKYEYDYYETFMINIDGILLLATAYQEEHTRCFHRNSSILYHMKNLKPNIYPRCLPSIKIIVCNVNQIKPFNLKHINLDFIFNFFNDFSIACDKVSNDLKTRLNTYTISNNNNPVYIKNIIPNIIKHVINMPFLKKHKTVQTQLISIINDAKTLLFNNDDELIEINGYCIGNIRWNNIFFNNRGCIIYDLSDAHYGNILMEYSTLITRLLLSSSNIDKLLTHINSKENNLFNSQIKNKNLNIRLKHLLIYLICDTINIIDEISNKYNGSCEETINLKQIDSIDALLDSIDIEFAWSGLHPELKLSDGSISIIDYANIQVKYLEKLLKLAKHKEKQIISIENINNINLSNIKFNFEDTLESENEIIN
ncbi:hypothetical protein IOLA_292 [uncultured bacterium]|nr:hypothetical protein IOLA_292 [uncultured bacterium]